MAVTYRLLSREDWESLRDIRLAALLECEGFYLTSYAQALNYTADDWQARIEGPDKAIFGLFDAGVLIGIGGVFTAQDDPSEQNGVLGMGFVAAEYRGQGLSQLLYTARIDWARKHRSIRTLKVSHREGNEVSRRAMLKHGFVFAGKERITFGDGQEDMDYQYVLQLEK